MLKRSMMMHSVRYFNDWRIENKENIRMSIIIPTWCKNRTVFVFPILTGVLKSFIYNDESL